MLFFSIFSEAAHTQLLRTPGALNLINLVFMSVEMFILFAAGISAIAWIAVPVLRKPVQEILGLTILSYVYLLMLMLGNLAIISLAVLILPAEHHDMSVILLLIRSIGSFVIMVAELYGLIFINIRVFGFIGRTNLLEPLSKKRFRLMINEIRNAEGSDERRLLSKPIRLLIYLAAALILPVLFYFYAGDQLRYDGIDISIPIIIGIISSLTLGVSLSFAVLLYPFILYYLGFGMISITAWPAAALAIMAIGLRLIAESHQIGEISYLVKRESYEDGTESIRFRSPAFKLITDILMMVKYDFNPVVRIFWAVHVIGILYVIYLYQPGVYDTLWNLIYYNFFHD